MKLWVLDSNVVFGLLQGAEPSIQPKLEALAAQADEDQAIFAISAVTVQEFLVHPRTKGDSEWHRARAALARFLILQFDHAAAEAAARVELKDREAYFQAFGTRRAAKDAWFRDAAIVGTAIAKSADCVWTNDGPMTKLRNVVGTTIRQI